MTLQYLPGIITLPGEAPFDPHVSIVMGTYNRIADLKESIESVRVSVGALNYEIIVVDGGSTDGSREYLVTQPDVVLLAEWKLDGAIRAFNKGFSLARGWAVVQFNDDAVCIGNVIEKSYHHLWAAREWLGQIAWLFDTGGDGYFRKGDIVRDLQTANLGICQAWIGHAVGWWGLEDRTYGGDNRLSLKVWELGYKVIALEQFRVHHKCAPDGPRQPNLDAANFWPRWTQRELVVPGEPIVRREEFGDTPIARPW